MWCAKSNAPKGTVPNLLPGTNTFLKEFGERYGVPYEATRGGAETMYPEYRKKLNGATARKPPVPEFRD